MNPKFDDQDLSFVAEALPAFISEAHEQIEALEQLLLQLEDTPSDRDLLDALFRCAHTIKGSAGIFGLDKVVDFTHHVETLLSRVRDGRIDLDLAISTLLLQCNDQIRHLIGCAADDSADTPEQMAVRAELVGRLHAVLGDTDPAAAPNAAAQAKTRSPSGSAARIMPRWHLSIRCGGDTFRNGTDPLALLNYLGGLGDIAAIACDLAAIPPLEAIDPEHCHLAFELALDTDAPGGEIESAFSFVRDDCVLHLLPPGATPADFVRLIEEMPDHPRLGEILVAIGALQPGQLHATLDQQASMRAQADDAEPGQAAPTPPLGELLQANAGVAPEVVNAALTKQRKQREPAAVDENRYIRVQADRLDAVINLLGELVTAGAGASMLARQTRQSSLIEAHVHVAGLIEEIRSGTLQLRMVPIGDTFGRFRRVVRDTAGQLGKDVTLEIAGGDTELDKSMVERIADPLMHLVRNSLDHGLETAAERVAAGKSPTGTLMLSARHESGSILITIEDDGRGISRERVLQRAWDRGLVEPGVTPSDGEILNLIFAPGFSTAEKVTNLSGRGVGMDVVKRNIEALRGSVQLISEPGRGTVVQIRLPLTLAIIDGFLIEVAQSRFIVPLESVVEVIEGSRVDRDALVRGRQCVELRGEMLPVVDLRTLYALDGPPAEQPSIVVVKADGSPFGIVVDALMGQHQTVIKPLGPIFRTLRGMSGSSILGNGEVALIFDVHALSQLAAQAPAPQSTPSLATPITPSVPHRPTSAPRAAGIPSLVA